MSEGTEILLVDDHAMFRAGIKALLEAEGRLPGRRRGLVG